MHTTTAEQGCRLLLQTIAGAAKPPAPDRSWSARCDRTERFMARIDAHLAALPNAKARRDFLDRQIAGWSHRYAAFVCSNGLSEYVEPGAAPIQAADFMLTISGLAARRSATGAA